MINRDSYRRSSPVVELRPSPSRPLRTEPIEIPTIPQIQTGSRVQGFSNQDQDYRPAYDQSTANGRLSLEERRVTYNRGSPDVQLAGTSFPKRESRFDRYVGDRSSVRPYEDPLLHKQANINSHWDAQPSWESHSRDRIMHPAERDRSFQSRGPPNTSHAGPNVARPGTRWDSSNNQNPHFSSVSRTAQANRTTHDSQRESIPVQHVPTHSFRTGESSNPRMDRHRHEPNRGGKNWSSSRDQPPSIPQQNFDRSQPKTERKYSQNDASSRQGLLPHPASTSFPVPIPPTLTSRPQTTSKVPIHQTNSVSQQQQSTMDSSSSQGPARREDPRLANRPKPSVPSLPNSSKPLPSPVNSSIQAQPPPSPLTPAQSIPNPPVAAPPPPQRFSSSSTPGLSRFPPDLRGTQRPVNKMPQPTEPPKGQSSAKGYNKSDSDVRKDVAKPPPVTDNASGSSTRNQDEFVSPLDSLYSGTSKSGQTGRGYGVQTYKIPKKKTTVEYSKGGGKQLSSEADPSIVISSESSSTNEITQDTTKASDSLQPAAELDKEPSEQQDDTIPLEVIENFLKKNLPSDDAKMVLDRIKTKTTPDKTSPNKDANDLTGSPLKAPKQAENSPTPRLNSNIQELNTKNISPVSNSDSNNSSGVVTDATVTSSGDPLILVLSEDDERPTDEESGSLVQGTIKTVTSSDSRDPGEVTGKKKGRPRNSLPLELARLREDLTDFMKGGMELGSRRCRSKSSQPTLDGASEEGDKRVDNVAPATAKRGRKRKVGGDKVPEVSSLSPIPPSEEGNENLDDTGSTYSSSLEPTSVIESPNELTNPLRGQTSTRGRPKKGVARGRKSGPNDPSPEGTGGKLSKKRKKPLVPTHLSLRGRRSMYEDGEQENLADQYFQCQTCSYLGQKIVHHYVNEHPEIENPYVSVPESNWEEILSSATNPPHLEVNSDLLSDLSWIPTRPNYTSPVQCKLCAFHTSKRSELMEHVMIHALPTNCKYRCLLCGFTETNFFDMLDHVSGHTGEFRYRCNYCNFQVAHRAGIKHHMNSMHESQDGLFYNTKSFEEENLQMCVSGFACRTCRYVQMNEEGVERHKALHPECDEHVKINLVTFIQEPITVKKKIIEEEEKSMQDSKLENIQDEKEKGVFLCPTLESVRHDDDLDEDQLTVSLKLHSVSFIETLAEKLTSPEASEQIPKNKSQEQRPVVLNPPDAESASQVPSSMALETSSQEPEKSLITEVASKETECIEQATSDPPRLLMEAWKQNALLQTIISKLSDKLGGSEMEASTSIEVEDAEDAEEVSEEEEDEEDSEESFDDSEVRNTNFSLTLYFCICC